MQALYLARLPFLFHRKGMEMLAEEVGLLVEEERRDDRKADQCLPPLSLLVVEEVLPRPS